MASVIFDELNVSSQPSLPSRILPNERGVGRSGPRNKVLRLDSPTTVQACQDLGIFLDDLKQKYNVYFDLLKFIQNSWRF